MSRYADPEPGVRRFAVLMLVTCCTVALANLPADDLPVGWLLAFTLPGAALGALRGLLHRPWLRMLVAVAMQTAACYLALVCVGPMTRPAALACTILPPLAFATARQEDADRALSLFLSFCVLLVGVILDGIHVPLLAAYGAAACLSLRCTAHMTAVAASRPPQRVRPVPAMRANTMAATLLVTVYCLFATVAFDRALAWLPSPAGGNPASTPTASNDSHSHQAGLNDSFVLGNGNFLGGLANEQLVRVRSKDGSAVPNDLYLRSGFFTAPSLDSWQIGRLNAVPLSPLDVPYLRDPRPGAAVHLLEIERYSGAMSFVFAPPATCEVSGLNNLEVDYEREWIRQRESDQEHATYTVAYQTLPAPTPATGFDPLGIRLGLASLPRGIDRAPFESLLDRWGAVGDPLQIMARLQDGIAHHCRYDRAEPVGKYPHAIENFLFADGDRRGYCMYFASAAALMLRMRGIPCRIGVGLHGGKPDAAEPGSRIYGSQNAHAWVEIPFEGLGYVVFDPTPPSERGRATPTQTDPTLKDDLGKSSVRASSGLYWRDVIDWLMQGWVLALVIVLALAFAMVPRRTSARPRPAETPAARQARRLLARMLQQLAKVGHVRQRQQTLEHFALTLDRAGRLPPEVADAMRAYQDVRFGGFVFDDDHAQRLQRGIDAAHRLNDQEPAGAGNQ